MKVGQYITFYLDQWRNDEHFLKKVKSKIIRFIHDPMKRHESKCYVEINGEGYGIPFSEILELTPANGEQLTLNL